VSEWNLSVRLTGQGSGLARTLRNTAADARNASNEINALRRNLTLLRGEADNDIRIRLDVDAGHLRDDVSAALTTASAGQGLRVRLDLDSDHLRDEVSTALTSAGAGQGMAVNLRLANAMQLRRDVENAVRWAAWGHRIDIPIGLADPMQLRRDVSAAVRWASMTQTIRVRVEPDTSALTTLGGTLGGGGGGSRSGANFGLKGLLLLAPAAIPLLAGLSTGLAPLPGLFAAGGTAAAAFGVAIAGQIEPLTEVADAEKKYQDAVRDHGTSSKEAMQAQLAYQRILADMPPETQRAAVALSQLKTNFGAWSDQMSGFTMQPLTHGITVLDQLIPRLTPHVESASGQLDRLITIAGGAVATPGFDAMADRFANFTDRQLDEMTDKVIHFMRVLSEGKATSSGPIQEFMAYAKENGPEAREAISAISAALVTLLRGAAEAGPGLLTLITYAARLVSAFPPELVGIIIQVATALKLLQLAGAGAAAIAAGYARVSTALAGLSVTSAAAGGGLAGLSAAFASLGVAAKASIIVAGIAAVALVLKSLADRSKETPPDVDKLTTSLGKLGKTGKVTGEALRAFGPDLKGLGDSLRTLARPSNLDKTQQFLTSLIGMDSTPVKDAKTDFDAVDKALTNLVQGGKADLAAAALDRIMANLQKQGFTTKEVNDQLDNYTSALADQAFEAELAAEAMGIFGSAAQDTSSKLNAQKTAADGLRASIIALNETNRSAYSAQIAFEQSVDDLTAAFTENGNTLDLNTDAGRRNAEAMVQAAQSQDEMIATGLAAGESLSTMTQKTDKLRESMLTLATKAFDGNKKKAQEYVNTLLGTPAEVNTIVKAEREDALRGLIAVQAEIAATPTAHTVRVDTLNAAAIAALEAVGLKTRQLPDGRTEVYTANGTALGNIDAVRSALDRLDGKNANTTITTTQLTIYKAVKDAGGSNQAAKNAAEMMKADGGVVDFYARGGIRIPEPARPRMFADGSENHIAQIAPAGSWRVWGEPETMGEAYVPFAPSKRVRSRAITEEVVRRLGGDPAGIQWNADGSVTGWRYDPQTGSLYSPSDAGQAGNKTKKVKGKDVDYFDLGAVEKKIKSASAATTSWNRDLEKVADRVGGDVAEALASMGKEGVALAKKMANGSTKYINEMAAALRNLQATAKASLTDYTRQLGKANTLNKEFAANLATLASRGYGDLASQLAAQNDEAAQQLAAAAVKDSTKASAANTAAKAANSALTADQVQDLVQIIAAITTNKTGIHDVAAKTGLGEDDIIEIANKAKSQISSSLGSRASKFLADLGRANQHLSYADGGIRAGLYATSAGIIRFAEPSTGGEAYLPLSASKRRSALPVLADVAHRFGLGLTDAQSGRPVVIVRNGDTTQVTVTPVRTGASASDIGFQVGRSVRRARRGGVNARAGS
jgi:hypothetical protein